MIAANDDHLPGRVNFAVRRGRAGRVTHRRPVAILMELPTKADRDAVIATGMEDGLQDALDLLEETAASLR